MRLRMWRPICKPVDGSQTRIVTGNGTESLDSRRPIALVGSESENGDRINSQMHNGLTLVAYAGETISGLFQPGYIASMH